MNISQNEERKPLHKLEDLFTPQQIELLNERGEPPLGLLAVTKKGQLASYRKWENQNQWVILKINE